MHRDTIFQYETMVPDTINHGEAVETAGTCLSLRGHISSSAG